MEVNIAEEPQATNFKDAEHVAASWTSKAYQTFRRVQTAGWWSAWCVPLQTGLHFKVTRLNLIQYRLQNEITFSAIKNRLHLTAANCWFNASDQRARHVTHIQLSCLVLSFPSHCKELRKKSNNNNNKVYRSEVRRSHIRFGNLKRASVGHQEYGIMVPKFLLE